MKAKRLEIRNWRVSSGDPSGLVVWFDPRTERVRLYSLTEEEQLEYLDSCVSVSALSEGEGGDSDKGQQLVLLEDELPF